MSLPRYSYAKYTFISVPDLISTGHQFLEAPAVRRPAVGHLLVGRDDEVVKVDVRGHGPQLQTESLERRHSERLEVLEVIWVLDLLRLPHALRREQEVA